MTRNKESGQALVFGVVVLGIVLMGFAGLGIDMGVLRYEKRLQQTAADAAAIAGANNIASDGVQAGALAAAATNGFKDGQDNVTITVNNGPRSGAHNGDASYVEVLVAKAQPTYFMRILGINNQTVTARAVAGTPDGAAQNGCLFALGTQLSTSLSGTATLNAQNCGIIDNGNFDPSGLIISAGTFGVSGVCNGTGCGAPSVTCVAQSPANCPAYGTPAAANPLASLTLPCSPCSAGISPPPVTGATSLTFDPGTYNLLSFLGTGTITFNPGTYIFNGLGNILNGITCLGTPTIIGSGVTFYFTNGATFNCPGSLNISLTAATSGPYAGILMVQDPADTTPAILGANPGAGYNGVLYFPTARVTFSGSSTVNVGVVVANSFTLTGSPTINFSGLAGITIPTAFSKNAVLVE